MGPIVGILYFHSSNPFHHSTLFLLLPPPIFNSFKTHLCVLYLHRCYVLQYYWCCIIIFSFPSFSTIIKMFYIWVCIWSCLFLCICLSLGSISHKWERDHCCVSRPSLTETSLCCTWLCFLLCNRILHYNYMQIE
jgi:hypothetical protein